MIISGCFCGSTVIADFASPFDEITTFGLWVGFLWIADGHFSCPIFADDAWLWGIRFFWWFLVL